MSGTAQRALAQGNLNALPGPHWSVALPGQQVFATPDSITKLAPDVYRAVIVTRIASTTTTTTEEIKCSAHMSRIVRMRMDGEHVIGEHRDIASASDPFERDYFGGPADIKHQNVCALARSKFTAQK